MRRSIILLIAISLAGCEEESVPIPQDAPAVAATDTADESATPTIQILGRGKEPRRALRWSPAPGLKERLKIRVDTELDARLVVLNTKQAPRSVTFELTVRTNEAVGEATAAVSFSVDEARAHHTASVPPKARKAREEAVAAMRGFEGSYRVDSIGAVQEVLMSLPADASREVWGVAGDLKWALQQLGVPLPEEAIGAGAEWTVEHGVEQDGVDAREVSTLAITQLGKRLITIKKNVQQSAAPQTFRNPGSSTDAELSSLSGEGTGEIKRDLTRALPHSARMTSTVTERMTYPFEGKRVEATMVTRRTLSVAGE